MPNDNHEDVCIARRLNVDGFNERANLPYGCTVDAIRRSMNDFLDFITFINRQLVSTEMSRLETFLMSANFSSIVGEFMSATLPKYCTTLVKNRYHNGHPDLLPTGVYPNNSAQHENEGIEIKASRYLKAWQGHNAEDVWLMVFVFDSNTARDGLERNPEKPFEFIKVVGARLSVEDWKFAGRSETSRRTITASVTASGYEKMEKNWIYRRQT